MNAVWPVLRLMYLSMRRNWRRFPHLSAVLTGALANLVMLRLRGFAIRRTVAIGLVEHLGDIVATGQSGIPASTL